MCYVTSGPSILLEPALHADNLRSPHSDIQVLDQTYPTHTTSNLTLFPEAAALLNTINLYDGMITPFAPNGLSSVIIFLVDVNSRLA